MATEFPATIDRPDFPESVDDIQHDAMERLRIKEMEKAAELANQGSGSDQRYRYAIMKDKAYDKVSRMKVGSISPDKYLRAERSEQRKALRATESRITKRHGRTSNAP